MAAGGGVRRPAKRPAAAVRGRARAPKRAAEVRGGARRRPAGAPSARAGAAPAAGGDAEWSYDRLWDAPGISRGWHRRNLQFWRSQGADVRGATGGGVSQRDLLFSREALAAVAAERAACTGGGVFGRALDLGAGIGRVAAGVLRERCEQLDLVELVKKHLDSARSRLLPRGRAGGRCSLSFHNCAAQKFDIAPGGYDLIWCQWLLMYLTDADALDLLRRAGVGLAPGGALVVKENVSTVDKATYFDDAEGELWEEGHGGAPVSCVRTPLHYEDLFERAGLEVRSQRRQGDLGPGNMDMLLFVLGPPAPRGSLPTAP